MTPRDLDDILAFFVDAQLRIDILNQPLIETTDQPIVVETRAGRLLRTRSWVPA